MEQTSTLPTAPSTTKVNVPGSIDRNRIVSLYESHRLELRRLILGVTRDPDLTEDVIQSTMAKAIELGHTAQEETLKGWLFRVAFHEALTARRRRETREQGERKLQFTLKRVIDAPDARLLQDEVIEGVRDAIDQLPLEQRAIVWARMYEDKTFAEIAENQKLPLGTVLTRMRLALEKLRRSLRPGD